MPARDPLAASRRLTLALALLKEGDAIAAADLIEQALPFDEENPALYFSLGEAQERAGEKTRALAAFTRALALDPSDRHGATLALARLGAIAAPPRPPLEHVRQLFDDYAPRFDEALVGRLSYRAPQLLQAALQDWLGEQNALLILDLGCGTGLVGQAFKAHAKRLEGIDLSPAMLGEAAKRGLYDQLHQGALPEALVTLPGPWDLILAGDTLPYLGDLAPLFAALAPLFSPQGRLAFTTEAGPEDWSLGPKGRYRHGQSYIERALTGAGFKRLKLEAVSSRKEAGQSVEGWLVIAARA